jgi:hypothetical protein
MPGRSNGIAMGGLAAKAAAFRAMLTAKSPIRSKSLFIFSTATTNRKSMRCDALALVGEPATDARLGEIVAFRADAVRIPSEADCGPSLQRPLRRFDDVERALVAAQ